LQYYIMFLTVLNKNTAHEETISVVSRLWEHSGSLYIAHNILECWYS
jgi:hypothetical protein